MKKLIIDFYDKYKKYVNIAIVGLSLIIIGLSSWKLVFVKYKQFYVNESKFIKAAKRYYEYHKKLLPKKGEARELTLQDLYDLDQINDLYIPNSRKMCDVNNSWVRVYIDDNGDYKYYAYLKCGKYKSRVDHDGPLITLNGDKDITIALNSNYEELGVKEVDDNKDKKIDRSEVVIDSSRVNTKKIGKYPVIYTARDSHYNKTVIKRYISVAKSLTDTVKSSIGVNGFYKGDGHSNHVLFSGMLWDIVTVKEDGSVKLILNQPLANLRANYTEYKNSNVDKWLNDVFYKALASNKYIVKSDYCIGSINSMNDYGSYCSDTINTNVGLLDVNEYKNTFNGEGTSISSRSFMVGNKIGDNYGDASFDNLADGAKTSILAPIRPVIVVNNKLSITSGDGTYAKPYKLDDYNYAKKTDKINSRLIGEYIEYSGLVFRIIGVDSNNNVKLISNGEWTVAPNNNSLYYSTDKLDKWVFDIKNENNPGYIINNDYLDYLNTKNIVTSEYSIPTNDPELKYNEYKTKKIKAKVVLPKTYDLFSNVGKAANVYAYLDSSTNDQMLFMANTSTGKVFELGKTDFNSYSIKFIITIKGNLRIESGKGTENNPYKLK